MHRIDTPGNLAGLFSDGDPGAGEEPTVVDADILNAIQEAIAVLIEAAGIALVKGDDDQLLDAVNQLISDAGGGGGGGGGVPDATTTVKGKVELATNAEAVAGVDAVRAVTPAALAAAISDVVASGVPDATTTVKGKVELATNAEAVAGADAVRAITPAALAAALLAALANAALTGNATFAGTLKKLTKGHVFYFDSPTYASGKVTVSTADPVGAPANGDIHLKYVA